MLEHTKKHPISKDQPYKVVVEIPGNKKVLSFVPAKHIKKLAAFLDKYGEPTESIAWEDLASSRIKKHGKAGLALRGARFREGLSQKDLAMKSGVSQENISKIENGKRTIGEKVAKKLAKVLKINPKVLLND